MGAHPYAATVILTYNDVTMTRECLRSVMQATYPRDRHAIYLVDNGSLSVSVKPLVVEFPGIRFLRNSRNMGFAAGNNTGIRQAIEDGSAYVFVLNNDTQVHKDYLISTVEAMESDPVIGLCGSMMLEYSKRTRIQEAGFCYDVTREYPIPIGQGERDEGQYDSVEPVNSVTGGAMCIRAEVLRRTGLFDPSFFIYWEDTDLCLRTQHMGYRVTCNGRSKVYHWGNFTWGRVSRLWLYCATRNYLWFAKRHGFGVEGLKLKLRRMPWTLGWLFLKAKSGRIAGAYFRGLLDGWRQPPLPNERLLVESMNQAYVPRCPYA